MLFGYGPGEILLCIGPLFLVIFIVGVVLLLNNRSANSKETGKDGKQDLDL